MMTHEQTICESLIYGLKVPDGYHLSLVGGLSEALPGSNCEYDDPALPIVVLTTGVMPNAVAVLCCEGDLVRISSPYSGVISVPLCHPKAFELIEEALLQFIIYSNHRLDIIMP
jgi:hypothetical protein